MLEEFDGATNASSVMPNRVQAWVEIHRILPQYRTELILKMLASRVGEITKPKKPSSEGRAIRSTDDRGLRH
jgi:hypothetical protein